MVTARDTLFGEADMQKKNAPGLDPFRGTPRPVRKQATTPIEDWLPTSPLELSGTRDELFEGSIRSRALPLPFQDRNVSNGSIEESEELEFARVAELVFISNEEDVETSCLELEKICRNHAEHLRNESRANLHRLNFAKDLEGRALQLDLESQTWRLLWHLLGDESPVIYPLDERVGGGTGIYRENAARLVRQDPELLQLARVISWLESMAQDHLDWSEEHGDFSELGRFAKNEGLFHETKHAIEMGLTEGTVTELDPDATSRQMRSLVPDNMNDEERLMRGVWLLLRCGRLRHAAELCRHFGEPWRASSLLGSGSFGIIPVGNTAHEAADPDLAEDEADEEFASEIEDGMTSRINLWKWSCFAISKSLSQAGRSRMESAVYAVMCGYVQNMLIACKCWEDVLWAYSRAWLEVQVHCQLSGIGTEAAIVGNMGNLNVEGAKSAAVPGGWPVAEVMDRLPGSIEEMFTCVSSNSAGQTSVTIVQHFRAVQQELVLKKWESLLIYIQSFVVDQNLLSGQEPKCGPILIRFGAHVGLWLRNILSKCDEENRGMAYFASDFGVFQDCVNKLVQMYIIHLIDTAKYSLVPIYALHLRRGLLDETYCIFLDTLSDASLNERQRAVRLAAQYLGADDVPRIIRKVAKTARQNCLLSFGSYAASKIRASEWLCMLESTHTYVAEHACQLCREFALAGLPDAIESLGYLLLETFPEDIILRGTQENIEEVTSWKSWIEFYNAFYGWLESYEDNARTDPTDLEALNLRQKAEDILLHGLGLLESSWLQPSNAQVTQMDVLHEVRINFSVQRLKVSRGARENAEQSVPFLDSELSRIAQSIHAAFAGLASETSKGFSISVDIVPCEDKDLMQLIVGLAPPANGCLSYALFEDLVSNVSGFLKGELVQGDWLPQVRIFDTTTPELSREICRRICIPRLAMDCLQLRSFICTAEDATHTGTEIIEMIAKGGETGICYLFTREEISRVLESEQRASCLWLQFGKTAL